MAAAREERGKVAHYKARAGGREVLLVPLAFETYGRWGASAALQLKRLARRRSEMLDARCSVDARSVYKGCLMKWRQELAVALQLANWVIWAAAAHGLRTDAVSQCSGWACRHRRTHHVCALSLASVSFFIFKLAFLYEAVTFLIS